MASPPRRRTRAREHSNPFRNACVASVRGRNPIPGGECALLRQSGRQAPCLTVTMRPVSRRCATYREGSSPLADGGLAGGVPGRIASSPAPSISGNCGASGAAESARRVESNRRVPQWCHLRQSLYAFGQLRSSWPTQVRHARSVRRTSRPSPPAPPRKSARPGGSTSACEIARPRPKPGTSIESEALPR